jgi:hypothetical protein
MNETAWWACADPQLMLEHLRGRASDRKLWLFACACCRSMWEQLQETDERICRVVEAVERHADGLDRPGAFEKLGQWACELRGQVLDDPSLLASAWSVALATTDEVAWNAACFVAPYACEVAGYFDGYEPQTSGQARAEALAQCELLRDVFGNPFRRAPVLIAWTEGHPHIGQMARSFYLERNFADLPVLGDALEEAGCTDEDVLEHCRAGGEHVRGCWLVDALLGKA